MGYFWAEFRKINNEMFRFNTRIYLNNILTPEENDICIGAVVGKNPGTAKPSNVVGCIQPINLDGDKLLPNVRSILLKSYARENLSIPERGYVQVLNLFYLCNANLEEAINSINKIPSPIICNSEEKLFPWLWYLWGGSDFSLNKFKNRFASINTKSHFYYNQSAARIENSAATKDSFARHTQGLSHELVVPYIASILKAG